MKLALKFAVDHGLPASSNFPSRLPTRPKRHKATQAQKWPKRVLNAAFFCCDSTKKKKQKWGFTQHLEDLSVTNMTWFTHLQHLSRGGSYNTSRNSNVHKVLSSSQSSSVSVSFSWLKKSSHAPQSLENHSDPELVDGNSHMKVALLVHREIGR